MIKKLISLGALSLTIGLGAGCGSSESSMTEMELCKQQVAISCDKIFNCVDKAILALAKDFIGLNSADCKTKLTASDCTTDSVLCPLGQKFHSDKANECVNQYKLISCADVNALVSTDEFTEPAACDLVCQAQ